MSRQRWMIYGANGYSGELIARQARESGLTPVLAGRNPDKVQGLAAVLGLEYRIFSLDNMSDIVENLKDMHLVLHCAGPFSATSAPMLAGCTLSKTHYLDITGEIEVFEYAHARDTSAKTAGILVCPGVGFDVIPTDCMAAALKDALPDAHKLLLGFDSPASVSAGTAKSSLEGLVKGGKIRQNGKIRSVPLNHIITRINFGNGEKTAVTIPWGDVSTAYYTTGIPNIEVYMPVSPRAARLAGLVRWTTPLLGLSPIERGLKSLIEKRIKGPSARAREKSVSYIWGNLQNEHGESRTGYLKTANGYDVTVHGSLGVVRKLLAEKVTPGCITPARLMGKAYISTLPGSSPIYISEP